jgi:hypothetical protein
MRGVPPFTLTLLCGCTDTHVLEKKQNTLVTDPDLINSFGQLLHLLKPRSRVLLFGGCVEDTVNALLVESPVVTGAAPNLSEQRSEAI